MIIGRQGITVRHDGNSTLITPDRRPRINFPSIPSVSATGSPVPPSAGPPSPTAPVVTGPSDQTIAPGSPMSVSATASGTAPITLIWTDPLGNVRAIGSNCNVTIQATDYGQWTVTGQNIAGTGTATFNVIMPSGNASVLMQLSPPGGLIDHTGYPSSYWTLSCEFAYNSSDFSNTSLYWYNAATGATYPPSIVGTPLYGPLGTPNAAPFGFTPAWSASGNVISVLVYAANGESAGHSGDPIVTCPGPVTSLDPPVVSSIWISLGVAGASSVISAYTTPVSITCKW